jgi:hypothetical protein
MNYKTIQTTFFELLNTRELLAFSQNWCQGESNSYACTLGDALILVGVDETDYKQHINEKSEYGGDLKRGQVPEAAWFLRQVMNKIAPEFGGLIYKWNDAPGRTHEEVKSLIASAIKLAMKERQKLFNSDGRYDTSGLALDRWGETDGSRLCAMSAVSKMLGYERLTDMPSEVDPALASLVNLLNDRATDRSRQLLASRLTSIPFSRRTNITSLISRVFLRNVMIDYGYFDEVRGMSDCEGQTAHTAYYESLIGRFLEPDGTGPLAMACTTLVASHKADNPIMQDLLAVSAASQVVGYQEGRWWLDLLHILDYIIGIEDTKCMDNTQAASMYDEYFASPRIFSKDTAHKAEEARSRKNKRKVYEYDGIKIRYFPAVLEKFSSRLDDIAECIREELDKIGQRDVELHRFKYEDEEIIITTYWDELYDVVDADADLVAYKEVVGELDLDGDGKATPILMPVPASEAKTVH